MVPRRIRSFAVKTEEIEMTKTALVLGATGGIGGEVARTLRYRGWRVRALHRNAAAMQGRDGLDWLAGDAMVSGTVVRAAAGAELIVHAVNPPGYRNWGELVLPMLDSTTAAARASGARILLPGTVYNYGPDAWPDLTETSPQNPTTRKGAIRVAMEQRLEVSGLPVTVLRAGDFFGPRAGNSWFSQVLIKAGRPVTTITYPGAPGVGHQWAYLPDVAETMVRLVEAGGGERFATFHMEGHWDATADAMIAAIREASGRRDLPVRRFPWPLVRLASPVVPLFRELTEMREFWRVPVRMRNAKLVAAISPEPRTPLATAVRETLAGMDCLPTAQPAVRVAACP
jgi:nucleoside-diphosphate-sugar epimerase